MITALGWTWEYIDENVTLPRLAALNKHWKHSPPVHRGLARLNSALLKASPSSQGDTSTDDKPGTLADLMAFFGHAGGKVKQ